MYYFEEKLYTMKSHLVNQVTSSYAGKNTSNITATTNILRELAHDKKQENVESSMAQCKRHAPANQGKTINNFFFYQWNSPNINSSILENC